MEKGMNKIRLGIIGIRGLFKEARGWYSSAGFELCAIANPSLEVQSTAKEIGIRPYDDYREMLSDESIEAVYIATPNYMHCEQALASIEAGKHVLCEKPLATTLAECDKIADAAEKSEAVFQVGLEYRYSKYFREMKKILSGGEIGRVQMIWCKEFRSPFYPGFENWRLKEEKSGGALVEKVCHHFDIFEWMVESTPTKVAAFGSADNVYRNHPAADIIDNAWVIVEYASGARGMLGMCLCLEMFDKVELGAVGSEGMLEGVISETFYRGSIKSAKVLKAYRANEIIVSRTKEPTRRSAVEIPPAADVQGHHGTFNQWAAFAECIRKGERPFVDVQVGRSSIVAAAAAQKSIREGRVIDIKEFDNEG